MSWHFRFNKNFSVLTVPVLLLLGSGAAKADPATVKSFISHAGLNYLYDFAITNTSSTDPYAELLSVDFSLPAGSLVGGVIAPPGNGVVSDPSGNFIEFSSNNLTGFALGATVDGFQFISSMQFSSLAFTANYFNHTETTLTPFNGTTTPVPEPGTVGLLAGASLFLLGGFRRLRGR